jgi:lipopolysaccharide/colanic/teichoic acid biosynthesis glycosyltransferase
MLRWQKRILRFTYMLIDFIILIISISMIMALSHRLSTDFQLLTPLEVSGLISLITISYFSMFLFIGIYDALMKSPKAVNRLLLLQSIFAFTAGHFISYGLLFMALGSYNHWNHFLFTVLFFLLSNTTKGLYHRFRKYQDENSEKIRNVLMIGQSPNGVQYVDTIQTHHYLNYRIIGYLHIKESMRPRTVSHLKVMSGQVVAERQSAVDEVMGVKEGESLFSLKELVYGPLPHLGGLDDLEEVIRHHVVDEVVVTRSLSYDDRLEEALKTCQDRGITVVMLLKRQNYLSTNATVAMIDDIPAVKFHTVSLHEGQLMAKRLLDIVGAMVGMILFGISYLLIAPLIKLESPGPVIFKQERVGRNGRVFEIWKYRTMCSDAEAKKTELAGLNEVRGHMFKLTHDPRVTRIGQFLRKTSLDEIPQFYNVLIGKMSLVGTRPPTVEEVQEYQTHHYKRISVIPGITGMWQISGRSEIKDFEEVVNLDNAYINNWTIWKDIKIIAKTVVVVIRRKGSH